MDHLGNVRVLFTADPDVNTTTASMEPSATEEQSQFINMDNNVPMAAANVTPGGTYAARVNSVNPIGPGTVLKVYPRDTVEMKTYAYYEGGSGYSNPAAFGDFVGALVSSFDPVVASGEAANQLLNSFNAAVGVAGVIGSNDDGIPGGYLNYIFMDKDLNFNPDGSHPLGFKQITTAADFNTELVEIPALTIEKEGYIFVYVSNESNTANYVHFDGLEVTVKESPIIQTNDYYPGGAVISATSFNRESSPINERLYQGKELQSELGLDVMDFGLRVYDQWSLRTWQIDPGADFYYSQSPYSWAAGNPIKFIDPTGAFTELFDSNGNKIGEDENGNDGNVSIITNKADVKRIKKNTKNGQLATAEDVSSGFQTTKTVLNESLNVLERAENNGGLREEISVITNDGTIVRGETGELPTIENGVQTAQTEIPELPEGTIRTQSTSIHSHPTTVQIDGDQAFPQTATNPSDVDKRAFTGFGTNIIVGNLDQPSVTKDQSGAIKVGSASKGAAIYNRGFTPVVNLKRKSIRKIVE